MSVITKDLGIASAYGYAKSKGYTGTEEEFAELMASYADVAQQAEAAAQDAEDAMDAAVSAKNDAVTAKTAAESAQAAAAGSAQTASTKATEASNSASAAAGSATAAGNSATAAAGSASTAQTAAQTATTKASEASSSASAANTAKTDAQTARTGAQTAQTAAETAQANAEAAASSVSASAAQIEQNTEEIGAIKNDLSDMNTATASDVGKALKAKTVSGGKVTEWEFGESGGGSFVDEVKRNLINKATLTEGTLNTSDGSVMTNGANKGRWTSDFVPVTNGQVIRTIKVHNVIAYDAEKQFVRTKISQNTLGNTRALTVRSDEAFVRFDFYKSWLDDAFASPIEYYDTTDINGTVYIGVDETGRQIVTKSLSDYANDNPLLFFKTKNLFDYLHDEYFIKSSIVSETGVFTYYVWDSNVPDSSNAYIATKTYYPVTYGQTLFCNYGLWDSACYDSNKDYLGKVTARDPFVGWVAPEGCAYVRLNIKGSNANPTPSDRIGNISEMHKVILYALDTDQTIAPKPMEGLLPYQVDGRMIAPNYLDTVIPNMVQSEFLSAMKCMAIRECNGREHAWRFGNFNMCVTAAKKGWYMARKMFMDYGLDFCGLEEVNTTSDISKFMQSWQFPYGFSTNFSDGEATIDKSLLSRFPVLSSSKLYTTSSGSSVALLNSKIQLPRLNDVYNPKRVLSVYVVHLPITTDANKVSVANEILAFIANDTSDYIIIFGDTNDFATTEEGKLYWRTFESGGFTPVIPITTKTVTQDNLSVVEGDENKQWREHSIDQFMISSNITALNYGVVNTKDEYGLTSISGNATDNDPALSDHDFVWCDLKFLDAVRSNYPASAETKA